MAILNSNIENKAEIKSPTLTPLELKKLNNKKKLQEQRARDSEMVKGIFRFHEVPGGGVSFSYKFYQEDQVERYDLVDGNVYTIPLGVARHLNKNCWYPIYEYMKDENTQNVMRLGQKVRRVSFQSLEFVDIEDLKPEGKGVITAESLV